MPRERRAVRGRGVRTRGLRKARSLQVVRGYEPPDLADTRLFLTHSYFYIEKGANNF